MDDLHIQHAHTILHFSGKKKMFVPIAMIRGTRNNCGHFVNALMNSSGEKYVLLISQKEFL